MRNILKFCTFTNRVHIVLFEFERNTNNYIGVNVVETIVELFS